MVWIMARNLGRRRVAASVKKAERRRMRETDWVIPSKEKMLEIEASIAELERAVQAQTEILGKLLDPLSPIWMIDGPIGEAESMLWLLRHPPKVDNEGGEQ